MRTLTLAMLLPLLLSASPVAGAGDSTDDHARLEVDQTTYAWPASPYAVPVCFTFTNIGDATLFLPNGAPWLIRNAVGAVVYAPGATQAIDPLAPGETREGCWLQDEPATVLPTRHYVEWQYYAESRAGRLTALRAPFDLVWHEIVVP